MRKLQLVKGSTKEHQPREARGGTVSGERRYRYPAEEIWEVSEERWQPRETPHLQPKGMAAS
jgi:hypothetical protein